MTTLPDLSPKARPPGPRWCKRESVARHASKMHSCRRRCAKPKGYAAPGVTGAPRCDANRAAVVPEPVNDFETPGGLSLRSDVPGCDAFGRSDPGGGRQRCRRGWTVDNALGCGRVRGAQHDGIGRPFCGGEFEMRIVGRVESEPGVPVFGVVPPKRSRRYAPAHVRPTQSARENPAGT